MNQKLFAFTMLVALLSFSLVTTAPSVHAASGSCTANPGSAAVGTTFHLTADGFTPNTSVWLYATEPDGTAFSDPTFNAFGGTAKANAQGQVQFSFITRFDVEGYTISRAFGTWTLVVQELGPGDTTVHQANCTVVVTSNDDAPISGAALTATSVNVGHDVAVSGSGFAPNEMVNLWVSPPAGCSSFAFILPNALHHYSASSAYAQASVKANGSGAFAYALPTYSFYTCLGEWAVSAYAPGSGRGAIALYEVSGNSITSSAGLTVFPTAGYSRGDTFTFSGEGFTPNSVVTCWMTRPEGTTRSIGNFQATSSGAIAFAFTTGFDFEGDFDGNGQPELLHYSEGSLGTYAMSCRDNTSGVTGETTFILNGLVSDP